MTIAPRPEPVKGLVTVIVPVYNERKTVDTLLNRLLEAPFEKQIVVVDDGSTDGTISVLLQRPGITLVQHPKNIGKGMAIRSGIAHAKGEVCIIQDADLEYSPDEIPNVVKPILDGQVDVVYGNRFWSGLPHDMAWPNKLVNRLLAGMVRVLYRVPLQDEATCYKAFRSSVLKSVPLECHRFEFCPEVTAKLLRQKMRILEVPLYHYKPRTHAEHKKIRWTDGVEAIWTLIRYRFWK